MVKILIVDDDLDSRELMKERLEYVGHETEEAQDGVIGIEMVASWDPDVILLDLIMPNADGYDVLKAMKRDEQGLKIPTVILSGQDQFEAVSKALKLGASDYLDKPCTFEDLVNAVHTVTMRPAEQVPPPKPTNFGELR